MANSDERAIVIAEEIVNLAETAGDGEVVWVSVSEDHTVLVLVSADIAEWWPSPYAAGWSERSYERQATRPTEFRFVESSGGATRTSTTILAERRIVAAAAFPGNRFLIRSAWRHNAQDEFVHLIDREGTVHGSFRVGHRFLPTVTSSGRMWATYGDQAAYQEGGIVCLDPTGRLLLKWNQEHQSLGVPDVFDCYADNVVSDDEAWFWYLDHGFTLVRMTGLAVDRVWQDLPIEYSQAFAAAGDTVLFHGGYHQPEQLSAGNPRRDESHFHLVDLERMDYREFYPVNTDGRPLITEHAFGRGPKLYFQDSGVLYAVDASKLSV